MADSGDVKRCCTELDKHKESLAKRANHYGVKSIVPPHDPKLNVMVVDVEDLGKAVESSGACSLCRCYKSKKFPYCDGSHNSHNEGTGDNAGPIVILPEDPGSFPKDTEACACAQFSAAEASKPVPGPRANNYGVKSNTPADDPSRRVDKVGIDLLRSVVDEDGSAILCRCYRSSTFPWCDGQHLKHNKQCGDNVGPVVIRDKRKRKAAGL